MEGCGCSPVLGSGNKQTVKIWNSAIIGGVVVMTSNSHHESPGLITGRSQVNYFLLPQKWCVETMGEGNHKVMCKGRQLFHPE